MKKKICFIETAESIYKKSIANFNNCSKLNSPKLVCMA